MATATLDFERPLLELERQIEELKRVAGETAVERRQRSSLRSRSGSPSCAPRSTRT